MSALVHNRTTASDAYGAPQDGIALRDLLAVLWRRKLWVVVPMIVAGGLAAVWLASVNPLYRSSAKLLIESQETVYTRPESSSQERSFLDEEAVRSQEQLILSADLSREIIRKVDLASHSEFAPGGGSLFSSLFSLIGITREPNRSGGDEQVLRNYYKSLNVYQIERSRVISIDFSSEDPVLAANVANAVAEGYVEMQRAAKRDVTLEASAWLGTQIEELRRQVGEAERQVELFRREHGLFANQRGPEPQTLSQQQLSELTSQLAGARTQKSDVQARARLIGEMLASGAPLEAMDILNSQLIQNLDQEQVRLRAQLAEVSSTLGPLHPRIRELTAEIADLRRQIRAEAERVVRALENDARVAAEREAQILADIEMLKANAADANDWDVQLRALEREARSRRDLLETMLARFTDASARETLSALPADARIISRAAPASEPYFPQGAAILVAIMLAAGVVSGGIVLTSDLLRALREVKPMSGVPAYVVGPDPAFGAGERPLAGAAPLNPLAAVMGLDDLRIAILREPKGEESRVVLVTSVHRVPALSEMILRLARQVSAAGRRVVVVDTAFGENSMEAFVGQVARGLGDLLSGNAAFDAAIFRDRDSRVHIIPAGQRSSDPLMLLALDRMDTVLEALHQTYDVVILLAPAISRRAEARVLARRASFAAILTQTDGNDAASLRARNRLKDAGIGDVALVTVEGLDRAGQAFGVKARGGVELVGEREISTVPV